MNKNTRFSAQVGLISVGLWMRRWQVWEVVEQSVKIKQKVINYRPVDKLKDALLNILVGGQGVVEINTRLRPDRLIQAAFGRQGCAEQSVVSDTLNACRGENVEQMTSSLQTIYQAHSQGYRHGYEQRELLLDVDMTGMPAGRQGEGVTKGYFAGVKNRRGRQLGRVLATDYDEIVVDQLYEGTRQLDRALPELVKTAEEVLGLDEAQRARTILRLDAGGGTDPDLNWLLGRGYQVLAKVRHSQRAAKLCRSVTSWYADPKIAGREVGWVETPHAYARPTRQLGIRVLTKTGQWSYHVVVFTLTDETLFRLGRQPVRCQPTLKHLAFAALYAYDFRSGGVETANKGSKQGLGLAKRNKKSFTAQTMLVLLAQLAYNLLTWTRHQLAQSDPAFRHLGPLRMVRDVFHISGCAQIDAHDRLLITLNQLHPWSYPLVTALSAWVPRNDMLFILGQI